MPDRFQVHAETSDDENTVRYCTDDIPVTPGLNGNVFIQLNPSTPTCTHRSNSLKAYRKYNATITAKNYCGENNSTGKILFSKSCDCATVPGMPEPLHRHLTHLCRKYDIPSGNLELPSKSGNVASWVLNFLGYLYLIQTFRNPLHS